MISTNVQMTPIVGSNNIEAVGYDEARKELYVRFLSKGSIGVPVKTYLYENVSTDLHKLFLEAESKGKFFHANVRGKFSFKVV